MAYRRKQGISRASTFKEEIRHPPPPPDDNSSPSSLAAQAIRASSAHRDSSLSSAYGESAFASNYRDSHRSNSFPAKQDSTSYEYTSMKNLNESKFGFWNVLAKKAKSILEDDNVAQQLDTPGRSRAPILDTSTAAVGRFHDSHRSPESGQKTESPSLQKRLNAISHSINYIGGTIGNAFEEGLTIVENRTADIIQETRKLHIRKKGSPSVVQNQGVDVCNNPQQQQPQVQTDQETQLKASRDVAMAMAAKSKLLLRELKTVKADLAFAKERCAQLEEENRILRESREKGDNPEDDDLIRLQLETLLAEKARLAHENSIYARENRFLREIVEYHQLTMQDVVYVDEGIEEVTEVRSHTIPAGPADISSSPSPLLSPQLTLSLQELSLDVNVNQAETKGILVSPTSPPSVSKISPLTIEDPSQKSNPSA
ncbi:hypothetical protein GIB67_041950 [Kingdonia uniflora]|uniref:Uncharacterized protein n=1 Tax=Kingdonia uniflora TaxID=39325 RepID=A0A7J7NZL6_9MAGN|nr:hypothetical protein GIB67_041950 [Kingdonia uniflora]